MKRAVLLLALVLGAAIVLLQGGDGATYTVQPGDTLAGIAARYGVTVTDLVALNRDRYPSLVERPDRIEVGWRLRVPGRGDVMAEAREKAQRAVAYVDALAMTAIAEEPMPTPTHVPFSDPAQVDAWRKEVIRLANIERAKVGEPPLVEDPRLNEIAEARVRDMVERHYFSHYDPRTGEYMAARVCGSYCAEIAYLHAPPQTTLPQTAIYGWLASTAHRRHLLDPTYRRVGATIAGGTVVYGGRASEVAIAIMIFW